MWCRKFIYPFFEGFLYLNIYFSAHLGVFLVKLIKIAYNVERVKHMIQLPKHVNVIMDHTLHLMELVLVYIKIYRKYFLVTCSSASKY